MLKLSKYYKPFIGTILIAILLLFTQAMCDLKLPDYMSDIVNIGIQSNGLTQVAPEAISENGFELMKSFMTDEEVTDVENQYTKVNQEDIEYVKQYPAVENTSIYVLNNNLQETELERLNQIFAVASKTMTNVLTKMSEGTQNATYDTENTENIDFSKIYEMLPMLKMIPEETINQAREEAKNTPESMLNSVGLVFTQSFYQELGMDISKIQNEFIIGTGLKMLGICVLGIVAAILVGFLGSKIGAGIGKNIRNDVFQKVQSFSSAEFNHFSSASLITRTTNDITRYAKFCSYDGQNARLCANHGNWVIDHDGTKNNSAYLDNCFGVWIDYFADCIFI